MSVFYYGIDRHRTPEFTGDKGRVVEISKHASQREAEANKPNQDEINNVWYTVVKRRK